MLKGFVSGEEKDIKRIPMKGKNLFDCDRTEGIIDNSYIRKSDGAIITHADYYISYPIYVLEGADYTWIFGSIETHNNPTVGFYDISDNLIGFASHLSGISSFVFTPPSGCKYIRASVYKRDNSQRKVMLNAGSTPLPYEPYGYQEGWEVRDSQDRLIWGREDELQTATGTLPFKGYSLPVKVKSLLGNAVKNGMPSPQNIVTPEMCGVLNENLSIIDTDSYSLNNWYYKDTRLTDLLPPGTYTISFITDSITAGTTTDGTIGIGTTSDYTEDLEWFTRAAVGSMTTVTVTLSESKCLWARLVRDHNIVKITCSISVSKIRVEEGSTAYGWKVPFENHGENLFDAAAAYGTMYSNGTISGELSALAGVKNTFPSELFGQQITISVKANSIQSNRAYIRCNIGGTDIDSNAVTQGNTGTMTVTVTPTSLSDKWWFTYGSGMGNNTFSNIMLNLGSTPKPYSPYLNETIPVYLGEVPTVRRVRKLALTGEETVNVFSGASVAFYVARPSDMKRSERFGLCSHFLYQYSPGSSTKNGITFGDAFYFTFSNSTASALGIVANDIESFKTWIASEYQAGHPVTVWYALSSETTTISNEPLCKISTSANTYADELTTIQVHGLSAPLYGIGDYKDTLNLSTGVVTRKVKKLVLDGTEGWQKISALGSTDRFQISPSLPNSSYDISQNDLYMTHYSNSGSGANSCYMYATQGVRGAMPVVRVPIGEFETATDFTAYLAAQYQAGTPVCLWYVLATPETETVTVPTGMTGEIEGYLTQVSTPSPTNRSVPKWNGVEETGGTYAVTVYAPSEIPTTTGQNTLTVETNLAPSKLEVSIHAKKIHYGFKIDKSNDDSESAVIYTHDAVTMTPAHMDFTNDRFDYGSWGNAFFVRDCYPVALNLDGTIAYRLDPDDYTKKTDGTASDIFYELLSAAPSDWSTQWKQYYTKSGDEYILNDQASAPTFATDTYYKLTYNSSFTGNFMMAFPKVWFYRHEDSQYNYIEISNYKLSDDWKCYAHINASGQEVDFIYLPLFKGVVKDSKLRSLPGQIPQGNTTATDEVNAATALGSRWQIWDHSSVELINDLLTLMSKSIDSQGRFGKGRESGYNSSDTVTYGKLQTGTLIKGGKFRGFSSSYKEVKVFGIEGFWANRWDRLQGMLLVNNVWKIKMTPPYNFTGTDFVTLSNAEVPTGNGYLSKVQTSEYGSIPASIANGSSTKYFKDYFYKTATDTRVALRGGYCDYGATCGFRCVSVNTTASHSFWNLGASPVYK